MYMRHIQPDEKLKTGGGYYWNVRHVINEKQRDISFSWNILQENRLTVL